MNPTRGKRGEKRGKSERLEQAAPQVSKNFKRCQEPIIRSLHKHCILESGFARIFLFLEQSQVSISRVFSPASARETKKNGGESERKLMSFSSKPFFLHSCKFGPLLLISSRENLLTFKKC